ncbi:MAG TPA: PepSY domain-containing protein [Mariprofundaceae bacterium]|nr:PepSY domain-containing protein [Mariprofundaceae bacterium]
MVKGGWMVLGLLLTLTVAGEAQAGDHERARDLLEQGRILSLSEIMKQAAVRFPGKVLEVELEEEDGLIVYKIEFLGENDTVMEMVIDARNGEMISVEED